jgi:asparagine synthase (glutamine-hydrolysing)
VPGWITDSFKRRNERALSGYRVPFKFFGPRPSFQEGVAAIAFLSRQLSCVPNPIRPVYERRYPFLDRDLLEFLLAAPREQIVRPGQRRSLLRRALRGIVPDEILDRRRKAFVARTPALLLAAGSERTDQKPRYLGRLGIVDTERFGHALEEIRIGRSHLAAPLIRALVLEDWISTTPRISFATHSN